MKKVLLFGGGSIGRSFITPVLQKAGYFVTIADINEELISILRSRGEYPLFIRSNEGDSLQKIRDYNCISLSEKEKIRAHIMDCDLLVSSVGKVGLRGVCSLLAEMLPERNREEVFPLDLILAENIHRGADFCRSLLKEQLPQNYPIDSQLGLIETSIGKMVPLLTDKDRSEDPLRLYSESYNTLIMDNDAFLNTPPACEDIKLVSPIAAWVDRKLFIHNLGHGAVAYLGRVLHPDREMIWEVLEDHLVRDKVRAVMQQAASALIAEYPSQFSEEDLEDHISDLITRFKNRGLGDTVQRVGRDLKRKLYKDDRIVGAIRLAESHNLPYDHILDVYKAALDFGLDSRADEADREISQLATEEGPESVFYSVTLGSSALFDPLLDNVLRSVRTI